ncbi:branched-chain amino acid ABC transporter permease [Agrobacterium tumefaciens]|uniref:branched-chain amino acid ABC transporter permease n=1 Tax=Agrobacterium tumefaciens TaxID=358 RepID=UPI00157445A3|nr:branched-chain amino acid ABC transporter permease [Agrobacterium tumefaciens]NTE68214.1 branched-chain amino acid ABC transporter permease [Agrobacterium tumefaciens]
MEFFFSQVLSGIASGTIYACLALAVVMIYQAIHHLNFAQGELAVFSTYLAWQMLEAGLPYWVVFVLVVLLSFALGWLLQMVVMRPFHKAPMLSNIVVFIALFTIFNSLSGFIWGYDIKQFPSPFGFGALVGNLGISRHQAAMMAISAIILGMLWAFFRFTRIGLAMRGAVSNPTSSGLVGVNVMAVTALGWGTASAIGAVSGLLVAPIVFLEPNMMLSILVYAFAGAVVGGLTSPGGAVLGGFIVGIVESLIATYVPVIGAELKLPIALALIIVVLLFQPAGLFGRRDIQRV